MGHWLLPKTSFESYENYVKHTGDPAVQIARKQTAEEIIRVVLDAGLRGRGGAGFPTGVKWRTIHEHTCPTRFVVCNAAEGEPGTFKDRYLLRKNPYAAIEGMLIAAHVVGAERIFVALKASFKQEITRVNEAIREFHQAGFLHGLRFTIVEGPEEYLFGEEKGLLNVIDGPGPMPREAHYPPYELGLFATPASPNPVLMNNVETFSHIPGIIRHGPDSFRQIGTQDTPGSIIATISGCVQRPGVYEREAGITLKELFYDVAGGPISGRTFKAAISGVSNGVIPASRFDTRADFASMQLIGSGLGSAGFVVFDDTIAMPSVAQAMARFLYVESCNQCTACKHGLRIASTALDELMNAECDKSSGILDQIIAGAEHAPQGNRCYLPVEGAKLIPSIVNTFQSEFDELISNSNAPRSMILVPKIVDYDEATHTFTYDKLQAFKNPDWTYSVPEGASPPQKPSDLSPTTHVPTSVMLFPENRDRLREISEKSGEGIESLVNRILSDWTSQQA